MTIPNRYRTRLKSLAISSARKSSARRPEVMP